MRKDMKIGLPLNREKETPDPQALLHREQKFRNSHEERCFKGSPEEYIRLRAKKHRNNYGDEKQANVLDGLADEVEFLRAFYMQNKKGK